MEKTGVVNNEFYDEYGDRWYQAFDDPVALLRLENAVKFPWIFERIEKHFSEKVKILDIGCGGGFLSNELAHHGHSVYGVDLSLESLKVAAKYDKTKSVQYQVADAYHLPFPNQSFDIVTAMDFLEHVDDPQAVIQELGRVLRPNGLFFFHTFNRNPLSWLVVIKLLEWFIQNTPKDMHVIRLFIKPSELKKYCEVGHMEVVEMTGLRPVLSSIDFKMIKTGIVSKEMRFTLTKNTLLSYMGMARKADF